ncbi:unnamed protein product [Amoebophrya sp. A25]|nr:unnamed protein product [Amoebophrya sp. A25]|eukprot:GSA25T00024611001.1
MAATTASSIEAAAFAAASDRFREGDGSPGSANGSLAPGPAGPAGVSATELLANGSGPEANGHSEEPQRPDVPQPVPRRPPVTQAERDALRVTREQLYRTQLEEAKSTEGELFRRDIIDRILRNKRRSLQLFGAEAIGMADFEPAFKQLRMDIKAANEYGKIKEMAGVRRVDTGVNIAGASLQALGNERGSLAITDGFSTPSTTDSRSATSVVSAALSLPTPSASSQIMRSTPGMGIMAQQKDQQPMQGPTRPAQAPISSTTELALAQMKEKALPFDVERKKVVDDYEVRLSVYREGDQIVNLDNPDQRLRAMEKPQWHRPWKLKKVLAGHQGWVRTVCVDPKNKFFLSSGTDRLIKCWEMGTGTLKLTLTGHSAAVRALEVSPHHPYFYSAGEDNEVRCWDLNTNKIIRTYHGHLSAVYSLKLHPTLDVLATGGRDGTVRIWDIRTRTQVFAFGHEGAVNSIVSQASEPQFISGSADATVKLWDLAAGKSMVTLTNHKKGIRALAIHPTEYTFASCSADQNKVWRCPKGIFERNIYGHDGIMNCCAIRDGDTPDQGSILVGGGDDGFLHFWDWKTGYLFQSIEGKPQPGSLSSENAIYGMAFDASYSRLFTAECDKTVKIYEQDPEATEQTHPIGNWRQFLSKNKKNR